MCQNVPVTSTFTGLETWHGKPTGYSTHRCKCDPCREGFRKFRRESYQRNKAAVSERNSKWKAENRDTVRETGREWARANRTKLTAAQNARRAANRERFIARDAAWRDRNRERLTAYHAERYRQERAVVLERSKAWRLANPDRYRAVARLNAAKYRARKRAALTTPFTEQQLLSRIAYWGDRCYICRAPWEAVDHVKPLAKGGAHCLANFRPICTSHNSAKRDRWHGAEWAQSLAGAPALLVV